MTGREQAEDHPIAESEQATVTESSSGTVYLTKFQRYVLNRLVFHEQRVINLRRILIANLAGNQTVGEEVFPAELEDLGQLVTDRMLDRIDGSIDKPSK